MNSEAYSALFDYSSTPVWGDRGHVLIVEDENGPRQALRILLNQEHNVFVACDVPSAVEILDSHRPDVIITDLRMPKQSGIDLLVCAKARYPDIQVIILTGYAELGTAIQAVEHGAFAYIEKPYDTEALTKTVSDAVIRRRHEHARRNWEQTALAGNRFETLGWLMAGMMHDLGAPLSVIESQVELLENGGVSPDNLSKRLKTIRTQVRFCRDVVGSAMNFIRHKTFEAAPFEINAAAEACLNIAGPTLRKQNVGISTDYAADLPQCLGDEVLVRQAILNLITNACHAMEAQESAQEIHLKTWLEGDFVCLSVEDSGPGIPQDKRPRVFDSFFTSREGKGTGLGLAVVKNVMQQHGGNVVLRDNPGGGAVFVLKFPAVQE